MTHPGLTRSILTTVFTTAERLGATMPKAVTAEHQRLLTASQRSRAMYERLHADLAGAVVTALENDRDPLSDQAVLDALTAREILDVQRGVEDAIARRTQALLIEHGPAILAAFGKPFDQAAATITAAVERLGDVAIDDTASVISRGGDAARVWGEARAAVDTITAIRQAWKLLSSAATHLAVDPRYRLLTIAEVPAETFVEEQLGGLNLSPWDAARRGFTLSLATPDELHQRITAVQAAQQRRQDKVDGAYSTAVRQRFGMSAA